MTLWALTHERGPQISLPLGTIPFSWLTGHVKRLTQGGKDTVSWWQVACLAGLGSLGSLGGCWCCFHWSPNSIYPDGTATSDSSLSPGPAPAAPFPAPNTTRSRLTLISSPRPAIGVSTSITPTAPHPQPPPRKRPLRKYARVIEAVGPSSCLTVSGLEFLT